MKTLTKKSNCLTPIIPVTFLQTTRKMNTNIRENKITPIKEGIEKILSSIKIIGNLRYTANSSEKLEDESSSRLSTFHFTSPLMDLNL